MPNDIAAAAASGQLDALKWRCIGPSRGGRVVAVAGDVNNKLVAYFGACAGGVWKTTDGGAYWRCVTDGFMGTGTVGALAVARSDSNVIYAGTGETTIRLDVSYGDGMYKSTDAGRTWANVGLKDTKHIGRILIHPDNPDLVYAAALGDIFGSSEARGVYRSKDGGVTWERILYRDADTGAIDMAMDAKNPRVIFATLWQTRRNFWNISSGGPGVGMFRSFDGGDTWEEITRAPGMPDGMLGKIGIAISPAKTGRVWALVEAEGEKTGMYRSDDFGARWTQVSSNRDLMHRPWYYTHVFADPQHGETVYVTNLSFWKSTDGGATYGEINTAHGDNHDLWIDPTDPLHMVEGNDGGAQVTFNGGVTWSTIYNQLTAQFYRIDTDNRYPYMVYGTQQDNTSIAVPSASVWGAISLGDCIYPGTGESGFIAVDPKDNDVVYVGAVGSSPGGAGALQRYDHKTRQMQLVNVWPEQSTGVAPRDLRYRFAWTYPIVFCPHDPQSLYVGGNHVFRSRDDGMSWTEISPDLSLDDESRQDHSGGKVTRESAGAEVHATCACVTPSAHRKGEIWASTDDGLVHVTRDGGASWTNVTPPGMPELAYVGCVEISAQDADTVYVSATRYKLADYEPYLFRTTDGGRSWTSINGDYPAGEITRVIRADPVRKGLLFVGSETGVFFSLDDGAHWARFKGGFPVVPVYDMKIKNDDLVVGTHGRSFWILDDLTPLRTLGAMDAPALLPPRPAVRTKLHFSALSNVRPPVSFGLTFGIGGGIATVEKPDGTKVREYLDVGENPPGGALINYWLPEGAGPVGITIRDAGGAEVVSFRSDDAGAKKPSAKAGMNRFVWDLRTAAPTKIDSSMAPMKGKALMPEGDGQPGVTVVPGSYTVELSVGGATQSAPLTVVKDPRVKTSPAGYAAQFAVLSDLTACLGRVNAGVNRIRKLKKQLEALSERAGDPAIAARVEATMEELAAVEGSLVDIYRHSPRDTLRNPSGLADTLASLIATSSIADTPPTSQASELSKQIMAKADAQVDKIEAIVAGDVAELNQIASLARQVVG